MDNKLETIIDYNMNIYIYIYIYIYMGHAIS